MTDLQPNIEAEDDPAGGIQVDANGDPVRLGTLMKEKESYERVVEGLKIAAEGFAHLGRLEPTPEGRDNRAKLVKYMDQLRRAAIQEAGLEDTIRSRPTPEPRGLVMPFRKARDRLLYGLKQAEGGARQIVVHRVTDGQPTLWWSRFASQLEDMIRKVTQPAQRSRNPLLLPTGYTRH